jgi:hypothetical protein
MQGARVNTEEAGPKHTHTHAPAPRKHRAFTRAFVKNTATCSVKRLSQLGPSFHSPSRTESPFSGRQLT